MDCELCNKRFHPDKETQIVYPWTASDAEIFWRQEMTLLEFVEHECFHEYEKAKRSILLKSG